MARLTGHAVPEIKRRRLDVLQEACASWGAHIVLKGARSLIGSPEGGVYVNMTGNPGMATAGSGDVLTGAVAAMFAMGLPWREGIRMGVFLHGRAGDLAAARLGEDGLTAGDLLEYLPRAVRELREAVTPAFGFGVEICP